MAPLCCRAVTFDAQGASSVPSAIATVQCAGRRIDCRVPAQRNRIGSLPAARVIMFLTPMIDLHGRPNAIRCDNSWHSACIRARAHHPGHHDWCKEQDIELRFVQPGKPDQNAYIERFNRSYRTEVLNAHLFESVAELRALTDTWLRIYNSERPHDSLGRVPPLTFLPRPSSGQSPNDLST